MGDISDPEEMLKSKAGGKFIQFRSQNYPDRCHRPIDGEFVMASVLARCVFQVVTLQFMGTRKDLTRTVAKCPHPR